MLSKPEKTRPAEKPFWGFDQSGACFRSAVRVENAVTDFVRDMSRMVREKFMSPADVEMVLRSRPAWVRSAFPNAHLWSQYFKPWEWFAAQCATSAEQTLKNAVPDNASDPEAHRQWVEDAERFHQCECRFEHADRASLHVFGQEFSGPKDEARCRVHRP